MVAEQDSSSADMKARAQLLKHLWSRLATLLEIHCEGYLTVLSEEADEVYIKLRRSIEQILHTDGFEQLLQQYPESVVPSSLHAMGDEADADWETFIGPDLNRFKGEILEFCITIDAQGADLAAFDEVLNSYDRLIESFRITKREEEKKWSAKVESQAREFKQQQTAPGTAEKYVDSARIEQLRALKSEKFDLLKLAELCDELNKSYSTGSYLAVAMLLRAIVDHVPPIFTCKSFTEVANNYAGTKSFKQSMANLENSLRKIADAHLHGQIRNKESLPTKTQVNFSADLDVLLAEIVRILK